MPPYGRLVALIVSGPNSQEVETTARALGQTYPNFEKVFVFGPAPAPLSILRGQFRWRLLLKAERTINVQVILRNWLSKVRVPNRVRVKVDVDPYSFL
jgi:primosomal protein N' (replication factor Y)